MPETQEKQHTTLADRLIGRTLHDGAYTILRVLGHGGMGTVYLAMHTTLRVPFAIKQARADQPLPESVIAELDHLLQSEDRSTPMEKSLEDMFPSSGGAHTDRFLREALLLARLEHFAIPTLYDYFAEDGYWYLVMDYIPGQTLSAYLREHSPLPPLEALNYAMQVCDVLEYLHSQVPPIIFRDLKPANIMLTPEGSLILVDFGIARYFKAGQSSDTVEFGSPGYAPPEQCMGEGQTDARSDLYSLGILLYEMLSGKRCKGPGTPLESLRTLRPELSVAASGLVTLATRSEPMYRIQSAKAFYAALERVYAIEEWWTYQHYIEQIRQQEQQANKTPGEEREQEDEPAEARADPTLQVDQPVEPAQCAQEEFPPLEEKGGVLTPLPEKKEDGNTAQSEQESIPVVPASFLHLKERKKKRQAVQHACKERLEETSTEQPLAQVDEGLQQRTQSLPLPQAMQTPVLKPEKNKWKEPKVPRTLLVSLLLLLLLLSLSTALSYMRFTSPKRAAQHVRPTAIAAATASGYPSPWQVLPSLPGPEADNAAVYAQVQGRPYIYVTGGYRSQQHIAEYDRGLYRYDILAAHWEVIDNTHFPGTLNNAAASDGRDNLFFTVGYSTDSYSVTSALYQYRFANGSLRKIIPPDQMPIGFGGSMIMDQQGHLYMTQGFMRAGHPEMQASTGWYRYDIATGQWHKLAPLPTGLGYTLLGLDGDGSIFLLGGASDAGNHNQTNRSYRYDILNDSWENMQVVMPRPLSGATSCSPRTGLLAIIGGTDTQPNAPGHAWLLDLHTMRWQTLTVPPFGHSEMGSAACDNNGHVYVERGADATERPTETFWELDLQGAASR